MTISPRRLTIQSFQRAHKSGRHCSDLLTAHVLGVRELLCLVRQGNGISSHVFSRDKDFFIAGAGGSLAQAYGSYALNTSLLTTCNGGTGNVTVSFNDPKELYGSSMGTATIVLAPTCSVSASQHALWHLSYFGGIQHNGCECTTVECLSTLLNHIERSEHHRQAAKLTSKRVQGSVIQHVFRFFPCNLISCAPEDDALRCVVATYQRERQ